ncbi:MAG: chain-length determining protein [Prevotellaceae bacterium]|nr:chain-length determining protein [Candidatus Colivivens equi]
MEENNKNEYIDLREIFLKIWKSKRSFAICMLVTGILSYLLIVQIPRYYDTEVVLAPEAEDLGSGSTLSSIASSFGFDIGGGIQTADAIYPLLYPELFKSNDFIVNLLSIYVETLDGSVKSSYYDYLAFHQKYPFWAPVLKWIRYFFDPQPNSSATLSQKQGVDPFRLTYRESLIVKSVKSNIKCEVDKKTNVITIKVTDQDPLVCATLADSVRSRLQTFITKYRTSKARADLNYYNKLSKQAFDNYQNAVMAYSNFCDTHKDVILQAYISERDNLEGDMQMKYNTYTALCSQLEAAKAKVQERTPAFTTLQNASVPIKPTGPKRLLFVIGMMILAGIICAFRLFSKELMGQFYSKQ